MTAGDRSVRQLVWVCLGLQTLFVLAWLMAGWLEPGYSAADSFISELAAKTADHRWLMSLGLGLEGLALLALAAALSTSLQHGRLAVALFAAAGVLTLAAAVLPLDCMATADPRCEAAVKAGTVSWQHIAHLWTGLAVAVVLALTPLAIARALWPRPAAIVAFGAGIWGLAIGAVTLSLEWDLGDGAGYAQRAGSLVVCIWVAIVCAGLLAATRPAGEELPLAPLRPGGFFHRRWTGEGEVVLRPRWLWKRFPLRFNAERELDSPADDLYVFHDRVEFERGFVRDERRFCRLTSPNRLEVTGSDLPDGAVLEFEDGGYRIHPYRLQAQVGPLAFTLEARDVHRVEGEALVDTIDLSWLTIPAAQIRIRMYPVY